jgi:hypothetical protein
MYEEKYGDCNDTSSEVKYLSIPVMRSLVLIPYTHGRIAAIFWVSPYFRNLAMLLFQI